MKKIPTLFLRDPENRSRVMDEFNPAIDLASLGKPTIKRDGTCVKFDGEAWWARREVKKGKAEPARFVLEEHDPTTGKSFGWVPSDESSFSGFLAEALDGDEQFTRGTYELCGPKVNGNPEGLESHRLFRHGSEGCDDLDVTFESLKALLESFQHEGIVWHSGEQAPTAKIKRKDFWG